MAHKYILSVDVGTSSTKTTICDESGIIIASSTFENSLYQPDPLIAELDGNTWWQVFCQTIRQVLKIGQVKSEDIAGIGIDGIGLALVPVDCDINVLSPVMIWLDRRCNDETEWLKNLLHHQNLIEMSANPIDESYVTPKLLWLKNNQPAVFDSTYKFLSSTGFFVARLTGEFTCDYSLAYGYHFFDIRNNKWDPQILKMLDIPLEKMPRLCSPSEVVGCVTEKAAAETGLKAGIPVIGGCLDAVVGALGSGVTELGQANEQGGQAGGFGISLDHIIVEPRLVLSHYLLPNQYMLAASTVGGGSLGWFRDELEQPEKTSDFYVNSFERYSKLVGESSPGSKGVIFLPYMAGERSPFWSNTVRGIFFGLNYSNTRADILRSIMEGCAFAVYDNMLIANEKNVTVNEFFGSGGATKSAEWCQIKADIYGVPMIVAKRIDNREGGHCLGLFALVAHAVGLYGNIKECVDTLLPNKTIYEPSSTNHSIYKDLFGVYHSISRKLQDDFINLDKIRRSVL